MQDTENLLDEFETLNFAHPAEVVALQEGAAEAPQQRGGTAAERLRQVLRDLARIMPFLPMEGQAVRTMKGMVTAAMDNPIAVDTQTTEAGASPPHQLSTESQAATVPWVPPLQWSGNVPEESDGGGPK